jgi:subtilase-type serine protease
MGFHLSGLLATQSLGEVAMAIVGLPQRIFVWSRTSRKKTKHRDQAPGLSCAALPAAIALLGGVFAFMLANPQSALAACAITGAPNTVACSVNTTTTDSTNNNAGSTSSSDRNQQFTTGGPVNPGVSGSTIASGVTVWRRPRY